MGRWGGSGTSLHLSTTRNADYTLLDTGQPEFDAGKEKLTSDGSTVTYHDIDRYEAAFRWSMEIPVGDVLHSGEVTYRTSKTVLIMQS